MIIQMRSCMCLSVFQNPRCRMGLIYGNSVLQPISYASIWFDSFHIGSTGRNKATPFGCNTNRQSREGTDTGLWVHETGKLSKWISESKEQSLKQQQRTRQVYIRKNNIQRSKLGTVRPDELLDGVSPASTKIHLNKSENNKFNVINICDTQPKIDCRETQRLVTVFVFDIETTGLNRQERIIEFALRDLNGGENSTFQTLINPDCYVPNSHVHGISTHMVNRPEVPRFKDLIPILRQYIQSRQIPNTPILLVSHNARCFDVPFLINEFGRCSEEIPSDWLFLDTLPLARELAKLEGTENLSGKSVQALREYYGISLKGKAHRAMSDVDSLSMILRSMSIDLKLTVSSLLERSFKASDIVNLKKKKKNTS